MAYTIALRIPDGKTEAVRRFISECLGLRQAEFADTMRRGGYTEEAYWLQRDPEQGDLLIAVSSRDHTQFEAIMANPQTAFDRWYRDQLQDIFGFESVGPTEPSSELLGSWHA